MTTQLIALSLIAAASVCSVARADNALTPEQLVQSIQSSVKDYETVEPDMSKSISALRTTTLGNVAEVTIQMNSGGMSMSAKYVCAPQGSDMACNLQQ